MGSEVCIRDRAESLNCYILGEKVGVDDSEFELFIKEIASEMIVKAGQKCTSIRRVIVPVDTAQAAVDALNSRLGKVVMGDPAEKVVSMVPLPSS